MICCWSLLGEWFWRIDLSYIFLTFISSPPHLIFCFCFVPQWNRLSLSFSNSLSHTDTVHESCSHLSFTNCRHTWLLLRDRLTRLAFTVTSPLFCFLRASSSLCVRPYWGFTRRAWWYRSSPRCTNPTNAMPAFPKMMLKFTDRMFSTRWCYTSVTEWWRSISSQEHRT